jgi:hypothetical protein
MSQHVKMRFLVFSASAINQHNVILTSFTVLIAEHRVQDISRVSTPEKEHICRFLVGWLMAEKRNGRSIPDRIKVPCRQGMNRMQHFGVVGYRLG